MEDDQFQVPLLALPHSEVMSIQPMWSSYLSYRLDNRVFSSWIKAITSLTSDYHKCSGFWKQKKEYKVNTQISSQKTCPGFGSQMLTLSMKPG